VYRAVLDTCVLVPGLQRHFLLQLATEEAFAPLWSSGTVGELGEVLARIDAKRQRVGREAYRARLLTEMRLAFPGAEIRAPPDRAYDYDIDDPGDGHVVHAALLGKADAIVTDDRRSGLATSAILHEAAIEVLHPRGFAANTVAAHPEAGVRALHAMAGRMSQPAQTPQEILLELRDRYGMVDVAEMLLPRV
jgi:predicted nucleic acid-binding protein